MLKNETVQEYTYMNFTLMYKILWQVENFLDSAGSKQNYRQYGEQLFDILLAGGILGEQDHFLLELLKHCKRSPRLGVILWSFLEARSQIWWQ